MQCNVLSSLAESDKHTVKTTTAVIRKRNVPVPKRRRRQSSTQVIIPYKGPSKALGRVGHSMVQRAGSLGTLSRVASTTQSAVVEESVIVTATTTTTINESEGESERSTPSAFQQLNHTSWKTFCQDHSLCDPLP